MEKTWRNIAIALAGASQAISLVEQLAKTGYLRSDEFETAIKSLLEETPQTTESVYGSITQLQHGLEKLIDLLEHHREPKNADSLRYMLGVIHLQKRLSKSPDMLSIIGSRLSKAEQQVHHFGYTHENVVANIAGIYTDTISKFKYRIHVSGEYDYLQQPRLAAQIRVLLLAAIRAATLWRQVGGNRWQIIFYRSKIIQAASSLLEESKLH